MKILGLDPSLRKYGWCLIEVDEDGCFSRLLDRGIFGTVKKGGLEIVDRYLHQRQRVEDLLVRFQPDAVGMESTVFSPVAHATETLFALFILTLEALKKHHMDVVFFAPTQVKSYAKQLLERPTEWKAGKADMIETAQLLLHPDKDVSGRGRMDDNQADAFLIAHYAMRFWLLSKGRLHPKNLSEVELGVFLGGRRLKNGRVRLDKKRGIFYRPRDRHFCWSQEVNLDQEAAEFDRAIEAVIRSHPPRLS